ncbi:tetratricopeptide repeat protein [Robbsia andropogonis]|uniref:tetratricopeptide repeat protein n=1 Tax=Robbsia andropogonis TaxID=28092 RepID=UPI00046388BA|nr:tetratricopeptide repeat protein [Robbsia andropogonis]MCP1117114.1 tetratricopeptide repeat protein [Robbsia andropogonis]MCP1128460.1 tetratricopeptide repeat protein [Robbsia andropogonis]
MSARPGTAHVADTAQGPAGSLLDSGEINLLNRLGYLAAERGDLKHAEPILAGVIAMRPNRAAGHIGLAFAAMSAGQGSRAIAVFENLRPPVPSLSALWRRTAAPDDTAADAPDRFAPHERVALDVHYAVMLHAVGRQAEGEQIVSAIQWDNVPAQDADGQPLDPALRRLADVLTNKTTANARSR